MNLPPAPSPRDLLPPLLACLPTAFLSPRPPPALLPLLSPLLRQRINFLASNTPTSNDGWLPLLSWSPERAAKLPEVVERMQIEPHPVSGEIELEDVPPAKYRRLDEETLHARLEIEEFGLAGVYAWDEGEVQERSAGWLLAELRSLEDLEDGTEWFGSVPDANDAQEKSSSTHTVSVPVPSNSVNGSNGHSAYNSIPADDDEGDEDDYWGAYDRTPGQTPAHNRSPAPPSDPTTQTNNRARTTSELEYFNRYGAEVQPALDGHDPDEQHSADIMGESTLTGDALVRAQSRQIPTFSTDNAPASSTQQQHNNASNGSTAVSMPRPISPSSCNSSVDTLEERAAAMSSSQDLGSNDRAQFGIKQHISTDIKSLFRLAKSAGMERREFERIVRTELDVLGLMEEGE